MFPRDIVCLRNISTLHKGDDDDDDNTLPTPSPQRNIILTDLKALIFEKFKKRSAKVQIYKTLIRPVVTYGYETWTLTKSDENLLRIFERKIQRRSMGRSKRGISGELNIMKN